MRVWVLQDFPVINFIHTTGPHWPPSRKREEAQALENLRKRVEQSKLTKANQITDNGGSASTSSIQIDSKQLEQLDNRPKLLKKVSNIIKKSFKYNILIKLS